jgi:hypothetical protein
VPNATAQAIKTNREEMQRRGWERKPFTPAPPVVPPTVSSPAPGPGSSHTPPATSPAPTANTPGARLASALTGS